MPDYSTVHVPQGRVATLGLPPPMTGVDSLFTSEFSSCVVITVVSNSKAMLMHLDRQTYFPDALDLVESFGQAAVVTLHFRPEFKDLKEKMMAYIAKHNPGMVVTEYAVPRTLDGVSVSLTKSGLVKKLLPIGTVPERLIRHPLEQRFLAVQKIEQIIGFRARAQGSGIVGKCLSIFDGMLWMNIVKDELTVAADNVWTTMELSQFKPEDTYVEVAGKLGSLVDALLQEKKTSLAESIENLVMPIGVWFEAYLNGFDEAKLFKRNVLAFLRDTITKDLCNYSTLKTEEDQALVEGLQQALSGDSDNFLQQADALIQTYKQVPSSDRKAHFLSGYEVFRLHYDERKIYRAYKQENKARMKQVKALLVKAIDLRKKKKFMGSRNLCREAFKHCLASRDMTNKALVTTLHNLGCAERQCGDPKNGKMYMQRALLLSKAFDPDNQRNHEAIEASIGECDNLLMESSVDDSSVPRCF